MSKKKSKAKARKNKALKVRQSEINKARNISRILTITILGVLSWFVYSDVKAESLDVQSAYESTEYLDYLHEIAEFDRVLQELQTTYPEIKTPLFITVCWSASQQRLVPSYMADKECFQ